MAFGTKKIKQGRPVNIYNDLRPFLQFLHIVMYAVTLCCIFCFQASSLILQISGFARQS